MPKAQLKTDVTIRDVRPTLTNPENYVVTVLSHLMECRRLHDNGQVRIGITGQGRVPSHKVMYRDTNGKEVLCKAYAEDNPFTEIIQEHTWSTASMNIEEI